MKIFKLFINENIKTWKKLSTKLSILAIIIALLGVLGLTKFMQKLNGNAQYIEDINISSDERLKMEIEMLENELKNEYLDETTKKSITNQLEKYKLYLEYNVELYGNAWQKEIIDNIMQLKENNKNEEANKLLEILKNNDFTGFIEKQKEMEKSKFEAKQINEQEYKDNLVILDLKEKYEIGKNPKEDNWKIVLISKIQLAQKSLRTGINTQTRKILKAEEKQKFENDIKINIYRIENNFADLEYQSNENYRVMFESLAPMFLIFVIAIVIVIIAGGTISTEISNGTIKFWALTPNRRWKILTAKLLSILFYTIVITLIVSLLTIILANMFFKEEGQIYIYVHNGEVKEIGNILYTTEYYFAKSIPIIIFALFAVMLSTITRNTAVSVSISMAIYMGNGIFMSILNQFIKKDWIKYVPFNNMNIADKIFPNSINLMSGMVSEFAKNTSLQFSLAILGACAILMLITTYDSFNKRDII